MSLNTILATAPLATTGFHIKATGTTLGNSLIWDNGTNVGIGNTNTSYTLDVSGSGRFTTTLLVDSTATATAFIPSGATIPTNGMYLSAANTLNFATNTTNRLTISSTGTATFTDNVLLAATKRLYLSGTSYIQEVTAGTIRLAPAGNDSFDITNSLLNVWVPTIFDSTISAKTTTINGNGTVGALIIKALAANEDIAIEYKTSANVRRGYIGYGALSSTRFEISNNENGEIDFRTNAAFAARITSGGNVGIGTSSPLGRFDVFRAAGLSGTAAIVISSGESPSRNWSLNTDVITDGDFAICVSTTTGGTPSPNAGNTKFYITKGGVVTINALGTGTVTATSGVLSATSDMNLKIEDGFIDNALEKVMNLKPRYFLWKEETGLPTDLRQLGFYAQEVNQALGEEAANTPKTENDKWGIYDRGMIAFLTAAIQEQQLQIQNLQEQINILAK